MKVLVVGVLTAALASVALVVPATAAPLRDTPPLYSFSADGQPFRWRNCEPLTYAINAPGFTAADKRFIKDVMKTVGTLMKTPWTFAGETQYVPKGNKFQAPTQVAPLNITLASTARVPRLGSIEAGQANTDFTNDALSRATVMLWDRAWATYSRAERRTLLLHELGHAMGLAHVEDRSEVMYPAMNDAQVTPAFKAGLARLAADCSPQRPGVIPDMIDGEPFASPFS